MYKESPYRRQITDALMLQAPISGVDWLHAEYGQFRTLHISREGYRSLFVIGSVRGFLRADFVRYGR